jgi:Tfp pilus assembly protein PilF
MRPITRRNRVALTIVLALVTVAGAPADEIALKKEISFGVKMAQRGLWNEALFRFEQAAEERPDDARVLNNLAVAYEAVGQFDKALEAYQRALRADPGNRELKRNYSRFVEFYQAFKPQDEEGESEADPEAEAIPQAGQSPPLPSSGRGH